MAAGGRPGLGKIAVVALGAVLLVFHVIRSAAVAEREAQPALAFALWPTHPSVLTDRTLLAIATAAAHGQPVGQAAVADVRRIAAKAPLSPDPFLIQGAIAETRGRSQAAEALLIAARSRDPRSRGARFLLAERFLRTGRISAALIEMQALVSLQSRGTEVFEPTLAAYARTPGAAPQLRAFFVKFPRAEASVLSILAQDAANADLVLALASGRRPDPDWRGPLVSALAADGQYAKAHSIWARLSGVTAQGMLFNPRFARIAAPPPFNWALPETGDGVAEPDGKGGVDVLYYGRAKAVLASQLLLLRPGQYRLAMRVDRQDGEASDIRWVLRCANVNKDIADVPLKAGLASGSVDVPPGCDAQWLELQGFVGDTPRTTELRIRDLHLAAGSAS